MGLVMEGEELLVGAYHTYPMAIGTVSPLFETMSRLPKPLN